MHKLGAVLCSLGAAAWFKHLRTSRCIQNPRAPRRAVQLADLDENLLGLRLLAVLDCASVARVLQVRALRPGAQISISHRARLLGSQLPRVRLNPYRSSTHQGLLHLLRIHESRSAFAALSDSDQQQRSQRVCAACKRGDLVELGRLFSLGFEPNSTSVLRDRLGTEWGDTPLGWSVDEGQVECIRFLLARGADPDRFASHGTTPLHLAGPRASTFVDMVILYIVVAGSSERRPRYSQAASDAGRGQGDFAECRPVPERCNWMDLRDR